MNTKKPKWEKLKFSASNQIDQFNPVNGQEVEIFSDTSKRIRYVLYNPKSVYEGNGIIFTLNRSLRGFSQHESIDDKIYKYIKEKMSELGGKYIGHYIKDSDIKHDGQVAEGKGAPVGGLIDRVKDIPQGEVYRVDKYPGIVYILEYDHDHTAVAVVGFFGGFGSLSVKYTNPRIITANYTSSEQSFTEKYIQKIKQRFSKEEEKKRIKLEKIIAKEVSNLQENIEGRKK